MKPKIESIEKGWGDGSSFFSTSKQIEENCRVDEITEGLKQVDTSGLSITVYRGYKNGKLFFEMWGTNNITITYED